MRTRLHIPAILMMAIAFMSCSQRDIERYDPYLVGIDVAFNWDKAPEASPDGMALFFYPIGKGGKIWRFDIEGRSGGKVSVPIGDYRMIAINNNLPGIDISGDDSYETLTADALSTPHGLAPTGMLYGCATSRIEVTPVGIMYVNDAGVHKECPKGLVRCYPDSLACVYDVVLNDVKGIEDANSVSFSLQSVTSSLRISDCIPSGSGATSWTPLEGEEADPTTLSGSITAFRPATNDDTFTLNILADMKNGKRYKKSMDISSQIKNQRNSRYVILMNGDLTLPNEDPDSVSDIGISVGVDGWDVYETTYDTADGDITFQ